MNQNPYCLVATDSFVIQPSDTLDVESDSNNTNKYTQVAIRSNDSAVCTIKVKLISGNDAIYDQVQPGETLNIAAKRIYSSGTTAVTGKLLAQIQQPTNL